MSERPVSLVTGAGRGIDGGPGQRRSGARLFRRQALDGIHIGLTHLF